MSITAEQALAKAKKYTDKSIEGAGAIQGESAYEIAVDNGFIGTEQEWLESLKGVDGKDGKDGKDGTNGTNGQDGQDGAPGTDGKSAYECAVEEGYTGTEEEWLASLKGDDGQTGATGPAGPGVAAGGTANQVLRKKSGTDYDSEWSDEGITDTEFTQIKQILGTSTE